MCQSSVLRKSVPALQHAFRCGSSEGSEPAWFLNKNDICSHEWGLKMDYTIELVAQAIHEAEPGAGPWHNEPTGCKKRFREYARNAIKLLDEDIGVLLLALKEAAAEERLTTPKAAA
jgi:hypothetical protein